MGARSPIGGDLKEACIAESLAIIRVEGVEHLSLREVARRLGVSHQAPYAHFASRDHLLAEIIRRAFAEFAQALRKPLQTDDPVADMRSMGIAYVNFALAEPLKYRLMFGGALPELSKHKKMTAGARESFDVLRCALARLYCGRGSEPDQDIVDREALFAWSSLHGLVSLMRADAIAALNFSPAVRAALVEHALKRIGLALGILPNEQG